MPNVLIVEDLGDHTIRVAFQREGQMQEAYAPSPFTAPLDAAARERLRWYLEDYLRLPYAVYEDHGQAIAAELPEWGRLLFDSLFGPGKPGRDAYLAAREQPTDLIFRSRDPAFLTLPWELLQDPDRATPLALDANIRILDRTMKIAGASVPAPPGAELRVLMVIARPAGTRDVGYQMIARPLLQRLKAVRGKVRIDVLRPPTLEAMKTRLAEAAAEGRAYHILHFDGHGTFGAVAPGGGYGPLLYGNPAAQQGFLAFETETGSGDHLVPAEIFATQVAGGKVPVVVLNACRSGMLGAEAAVEASIATRLLEGGAASVVAMGYTVYAVAAAEFMAAFYETLFGGCDVAEAVSAGRQRLFTHRERPSPKGLLPLRDWIVPVHYTRRAVAFAGLKTARPRNVPSLDFLLDQQAKGAGNAEDPARDDLAPDRTFFGRDVEFYLIERALRTQHVVLLQGPAGTGKTELAKAFARWWQDTGGVDKREWVFFHGFEPGLASFGLDAVIIEIGMRLYGTDFIGRTQNAAERERIILDLLQQHRMLLLWDNFESVFSMPDPAGATPPLAEAERNRLREFVTDVTKHAAGGLILTSRAQEDWLGDIRRIKIGGLARLDALDLANDLLAPYPDAKRHRQTKDFDDLLEFLDGHPLSLRILLPNLDKIPASHLLAALRGSEANLPLGFVGEGRLASLGASLFYSFAHLSAEDRDRALALSLFEGVADHQLLGIFSSQPDAPARFVGVTKEAWSDLLGRLARIGVVTDIGGGMVTLHPAMPAYLAAAWRARAADAYSAERETAESALLSSYTVFGGWLWGQIQSGSAETAFTLLGWQRRTMGRLLGFALTQTRYNEAQAILQPLNDFWDNAGQTVEADSWVKRCREALQDRAGRPPPLESAGGQLWMFSVGTQANRAQRSGDVSSAFRAHDDIRRMLEAAPHSDHQQLSLAVAYHQLGIVAQDQGDLNAAEQWYQKSLEIEEAQNNRPGMARSYHQLGGIAQDQGDLNAAEQWYQKSLEIKEAQNNRPGMASSYHQLGMVAQYQGDLNAAEQWYQKSLEINEAQNNQRGMASSYHQLGRVAQDQGDLNAAEQWYRKSLEILEAQNDRRGMASSYHQLGMVAQDQGDLKAAEQWYQKSLEIEEAQNNRPGMALTYAQLALLLRQKQNLSEALDWNVRCVSLFAEFPHRATGTGPKQLVELTAMLGMDALQAAWRRITHADLPDEIRAAVESAIQNQAATTDPPAQPSQPKPAQDEPGANEPPIPETFGILNPPAPLQIRPPEPWPRPRPPQPGEETDA